MPAGPRPDPPPFTIQAQLQHTFEGMFWETGHWFKVDTSDMPIYADLTAFAAALAEAWTSSVLTYLNELVQFSGVECVIWGNPPEALDFSAPAVDTGGIPGDSEAAQVAAVVSWPIARHHRGGHPRNYIGGLNDADLATVATLTSDFRSDLQAGYVNFQSTVDGLEIAGNPVKMGVVSFQNNRAWRAEGVFFPFLGAPTVRELLGTQRRRLSN